MSIIAKYKFDSSVYADLIPEFNAEFTSDLYTVTDEVDGENSNYIIRTIESESLPTLMRFGRAYVDDESDTDNRTDSLLEVLNMNTSGLADCGSMFRYNKNLTSINCEWNTNNVTIIYAMFDACNNLTSLDVSNWDTSKVITMDYLFQNCNNLTSLDVSNWDTSKVTAMSYMFCNCQSLTSLDLSNFNTSNVTNMAGMFYYCNNLITLDVSNFDTSNVTNMCNILCDCHNLTSLDVSNWDTSNVTNMQGMFGRCYKVSELDVSNWDTSNVTTMQSMFQDCRVSTTIGDVSNWDTSKVTNMRSMFSNCNKLASLDLSNWNTSNVTDMYYMFNNCQLLASLDVSNFNTSKVTNTTDIFTNTTLLTDIGMIYCDQSTINKVASLLPTDITQTIWVEDVDVKDLTLVEGVEFKQYAKNTEIMLTSPLLEGDKLIVKDGKLYHYHKMGMVVLDGSKIYNYFSGTVNNDMIVPYINLSSSKPYEENFLCNKFITITKDTLAKLGKEECIFIGENTMNGENKRLYHY